MPRRSGFTLLEMIVVLVVLGLAAGLVLGHGSHRSRALEARTVAAEIVRMLREARGQAIAGDRVVLVAVDPVRRAIAVDGGRMRVLPPGIGLATQGLLGTGPPGARQAGPRQIGMIRFAADGSASGGQIELSGQGQRIEVAVNWLTGRVQAHDAPAS